jgi:hypothetical protein
MTLGHLSIGFAAKRFAPRVPLAVLLIASQTIDILYGRFTAFGLEKSLDYRPWSHSLVMAIVWSLLAFLITAPVYRDRRCGLVIGLVVFSHWILDFVILTNSILFFAATPKFGLGLYNVAFRKMGAPLLVTLLLELAMLAAGVFVYISTKKTLAASKQYRTSAQVS